MRIGRALGALAVLAVFAFTSWQVQAQPQGGPVGATLREHIMMVPTDVQWAPGPPVFGPGVQVAVLEGNPETPNALFSLRAKLPAGWRIAPHYHPADEHVVVLSGTLSMGHGDRFDRAAARALPAGGFAVMPKDFHHYAFADAETVIQIWGVGPWGITFVRAADDPRNRPTKRAPTKAPAPAH